MPASNPNSSRLAVFLQLPILFLVGCASLPTSLPFPLENQTGQRALQHIGVAVPTSGDELTTTSNGQKAQATQEKFNQMLGNRDFSHTQFLRKAVIKALKEAGYQADTDEKTVDGNSASLRISVERAGFARNDQRQPFRPIYAVQIQLSEPQQEQLLLQKRLAYSAFAIGRETIFVPASPSRLHSDTAELTRSIEEPLLDIQSAINALATEIVRQLSDPDLAPLKPLPPVALNHLRPEWGRCHAALIKNAAESFPAVEAGSTRMVVKLQPSNCLRNEQGKIVSYQLLRLPTTTASVRLSIKSKTQAGSVTGDPEQLLAPSVTLLDGDLKPMLRYGANAFSLGGDQALRHSVAWSTRTGASSTPQYLLLSDDPKFTGRADAVLRRDNNGNEQLIQQLYSASGSLLAVIDVE